MPTPEEYEQLSAVTMVLSYLIALVLFLGGAGRIVDSVALIGGLIAGIFFLASALTD